METWINFVLLRQEHKLKAAENKMLIICDSQLSEVMKGET
jgi:chromatin remodeling complex protein RSC6